jgi:DNA replication protein DnaC
MQRITPFTAEAKERCPKCGKAVKMTIEWPKVKRGVFVGMESREVPDACDCQLRAQDAREAEEQRRRSEQMEAMRHERAFGNRVLVGSFAASSKNAEVMSSCAAYTVDFEKSRAERKNGLLLWGDTRAGKTFAAEAVARELHDQGLRVMMDTAAGFVSRYESADRMGREALRHRVAKCDLLVVDDFGASRDTSYGREVVFSLIDTRISANGPMVVTTNLTPEQMAVCPDSRAAMRIMERCLPVRVG